MKALVVIVSATLTVAILLAATLLIATSTRGENARQSPAEHIVRPSPATK